MYIKWVRTAHVFSLENPASSPTAVPTLNHKELKSVVQASYPFPQHASEMWSGGICGTNPNIIESITTCQLYTST
jgi:hypothetical protein